MLEHGLFLPVCLFGWHKAYLHVSNVPVALGKKYLFHLITFNEENCQNGQRQLQGLRPLLCLPDLLLNMRDF